MRNKKAQVSETMTWVVATLAIIVVLIISISVVQFQLKIKKFSVTGNSDLLVTKSFMGFLSTDDFGVWGEFEDEEGYPSEYSAQISKESSDLIKAIVNLFEGEYDSRFYWFGVVGEEWVYDSKKGRSANVGNSLGKRTNAFANKNSYSYEKIKLNSGSFAEFVIARK